MMKMKLMRQKMMVRGFEYHYFVFMSAPLKSLSSYHSFPIVYAQKKLLEHL
jgi:hypothetical protein